MTDLVLEFGALSNSIIEQLYDQNLSLKKGQDAVYLQRDADAITRCLVNGLISQSVGQQARKRLLKRICKIVEQKKE